MLPSSQIKFLIGNYWVDVIRPTVRFLLPLCFVWSLLLNSQGVPATFQAGPEVQLIDKADSVETQKNSFRTSCTNGSD